MYCFLLGINRYYKLYNEKNIYFFKKYAQGSLNPLFAFAVFASIQTFSFISDSEKKYLAKY